MLDVQSISDFMINITVLVNIKTKLTEFSVFMNITVIVNISTDIINK